MTEVIAIVGLPLIVIVAIVAVAAQAVEARSTWRRDRELERIYREWQAACVENMKEESNDEI